MKSLRERDDGDNSVIVIDVVAKILFQTIIIYEENYLHYIYIFRQKTN